MAASGCQRLTQCLMALRLSGLQKRANRRPDKAFMPPSGNLRLTQCLMALRLSGLQNHANP
ncbi:UNVERIFIED_ORG: hypothetical protein QE398_004458 [Atlantibacter sp. SORGH_AS 304]|jgi:hypothetical protein|nr:hypothetical protein [Atlantibacter sp. SORGH_AS_0304]